ncbi:MAG: tRNA lysidine(34) synthetase TilS [Clostridia bacterium]|nr:tRNA lysidine(34) synthetase TilS [Clostridia bacterium]
MDNILKKIENTIRTHNLIECGDKVIVGLSGGADSCCLLHALTALREKYRLSVFAAHVNHNLREEALSDQRFAEEFCKELDVACFLESVDVLKYSRENGISEEQAGRELRYKFFSELQNRLCADKIATAHNKNDSAETILMNFMRGSGLGGLCGIPYKRDNIVRPLLDITREEIELYCKNAGIFYVSDITNEKPIYTRNKIRLNLIPHIKKEFNPNFIDTVTKNAAVISEDNQFLKQYSHKAYSDLVSSNDDDEYKIPMQKLLGEHRAIARRVLLSVLENILDSGQNVSVDYIDDIMLLVENSHSGKSLSLPEGVTAKIEYDFLIITKRKLLTLPYEYKFILGEDLYIREANMYIFSKECICEGKGGTNVQYFKTTAIDKLLVRNRRNGDIFYPTGMDGRKKLKDFFIDNKIPRCQRDTIPILTNGENILWVMGYRADRRFLAKYGERSIMITIKEGDSANESNE